MNSYIAPTSCCPSPLSKKLTTHMCMLTKTRAAFKIIHNFACVNSYCNGIKCIRRALDIHTSLLSGGERRGMRLYIIASRCNSHTYKHPEHISVIELSTENTPINRLFHWSASSNCIRQLVYIFQL